jgi:protein-tyrosine phosphatase
VKQVVFLCSANFYRSRFAEHVFNHLARAAGLAWKADSRGLLVGFWGDVGAMSDFTVEGLRQREIPLSDEQRDPQALTAADLRHADLVVAVKEVEHRPLMQDQFPDWVDRIEYWDVDDLDCAGPDVALPYLEEKVRALITRLQNESEILRADVA